MFEVNSFQLPNAVVDNLMRDISPNALKCYLVIVRKTKGWSKEWDKISTMQLMEATGIKNSKTVYSAMKELINYGLIESIKEAGKITSYRVAVSIPKQETKHENVTNINVEEPIKENIEPKQESKEPKSQKGFMEFVDETREKYKGNSAIDFYPVLFKNGDDEIKVSAKGYLYSKNTSNDLEAVEAKKIWEYLYRHQDRIAPLEPQRRIIDRVHKPYGLYKSYKEQS